MSEAETWNPQGSPGLKVGEIVLQARSQPTGEALERYLDEACGDDSTLRAQVVALIQSESEAGGFLEQTVMGDANAPVSEGPGTVIGRYKLLEKIGEGGFGVVYVAEQDKPIQRRVALKIIKLGMDTRQVVARFEAERQALARMDHPNIAKMFDAGATESGRPYFVMELVKGIKITEYCNRHRLSPRRRLKLFRDVCHTIQHAHQKGIIHRDLKPSNILVTQHDTVAVPKVIDFGIAKATEGRLTDKTLYTAWEQMIGTPAYMSPEQAEFGSLDIDTRSDIYSLGVLLYELLTGRMPFDPKTVMRAGLDEVRRTIREVEPPKPSTRLSELAEGELDTVARTRSEDGPKLVRLVSGDLDCIVMKALEKDRSRRYETANGLARDVACYVKHEAVQARPPSRFYLLRKWARRNRGAFAAGSVVAAALMLIAVISVVALVREQQHSTLLRESEQRVTERSLELQRRLTQQYLHRGQDLGEKGDVVEGLHWIARALDELPAGHPQLKNAIEDNLVAWSQRWLEPRNLLFLDGYHLCSAFSPDGEHLLTGTASGTITSWSVISGEAVWTNRVSDGQVWGLAVSPDGQKFAVGVQGDGSVQLRSMSSGQLLGQLIGHGERIHAVEFSPDNQWILTGSQDGTARLWSTETGEPVHPPVRHDGSVWGIAFSPDSTLAVTVDTAGTAQLWSVETGKVVGKPFTHGPNAWRVTFSPDGGIIATGGGRSGVKLWSTDTGDPLDRPLQHGGSVLDLRFSPDGSMLLTACDDHLARVWSVDTGELLASMVLRSEVTEASFCPDGSSVVTASHEGARLWLWSPEKQSVEPLGLSMPTRPFASIPSALLSSDGETMMTMLEKHVLALWPLQTNQSRVKNFAVHKTRTATFSPDGKLLTTGNIEGEVKLWSSDTLEQVGATIKHGTDVWQVEFSPDGKRLASCGQDGTARLWDVATRESLGVVLQHAGEVRAVAWSRDGNLLATGSFDSTARIWSTNGQPRSAALRHLGWVDDLTFSPDGTRLFTACGDGMARAWSVTNGELAEILPHPPWVYAVDLSSDGRRIATGGRDKAARIWDAETYEPTGVVLNHDSDVEDVDFSPDGDWLLTTCNDGSMRIWSITTGEQVGPTLGRKGEAQEGAFSSHGAEVVWAGVGGATLWEIPPPAPDTFRNVGLWIEGLTHAEMDRNGALHWLDDKDVLTRKAQLIRLGGPPVPRLK